MAYRIACLGLALAAALNACTITIQTAPQPANGTVYYPPQPVAAGAPVPVAGQPYPVYHEPATHPGHVAAAPAAQPVAVRPPSAAPSPPPSAVRPPAVLRAPGGTVGAPVYAQPQPQQPQPAPPVAVTPPHGTATTTPPIAAQPAPPQPTPAAPVRRPVGNQKTDARDRTDTNVK